MGSGAFGVVVKGLAAGILSHEVQTTVAVKMVKGAADKVVPKIFFLSSRNNFKDLVIAFVANQSIGNGT